MKKEYAGILVVILFLLLPGYGGRARRSAPQKLIQTISMPGVQGCTDPIIAGVGGGRFFVLANGDNQGGTTRS